MRKNVTLLTILTLALSLASCAFKEEEAEQRKREETKRNLSEILNKSKYTGELNKENVSFEFTEDRMGFYKLKISWPEEVKRMHVQINDSLLTVINGEHSAETYVEHSKSFRVELNAFDSGGIAGIYRDIIDSPRDLIISNDVLYLTENSTFDFNRVYFLDGGRINMNGYDLNITAKYVYTKMVKPHHLLTIDSFQDPIIRSYDLKNKFDAKTNFNESGPNLTLNITRLSGFLSIYLKGFDGANGANGANLPADPSLDGTPGKPGQAFPSSRAAGIPGGCISTAVNGSPGKNGHIGPAGANGQNGGSTGTFHLNIKSPSDEGFVGLALTPGIGGKGGQGGKGTPGGNGGKGMNRGLSECGISKDGPRGNDGPQGAPGTDGIIGTIGTPVPAANINVNFFNWLTILPNP